MEKISVLFDAEVFNSLEFIKSSVILANRFNVDIAVNYQDKIKIDLKSIMGVASLVFDELDVIAIEVDNVEEGRAFMDEFVSLYENSN